MGTQPVIQSRDLAILKARSAGHFACITAVDKLGLGGNQMFDAEGLGNGFSHKTVGGGDDHQGVTLLPVAVQQRIRSGLHHGAYFFLHKGFPPRQ